MEPKEKIPQPELELALTEFEKYMKEVVIPEIERITRERQIAAAESRKKIIWV
jgi:hypothetical protein